MSLLIFCISIVSPNAHSNSTPEWNESKTVPKMFTGSGFCWGCLIFNLNQILIKSKSRASPWTISTLSARYLLHKSHEIKIILNRKKLIKISINLSYKPIKLKCFSYHWNSDFFFQLFFNLFNILFNSFFYWLMIF